MDECNKCHAIYKIQESYGQIVRNVCKCEVKRACAKSRKTNCRGLVVQALLDVDHVVERYVCTTHSILECLDEMAITPEKEKRKKDEETYVMVTPEGVKEMLRGDTYLTVCADCGNEHPFSERGVTEGYDVVCPKCSSKNIKEYHYATPYKYTCPKCGDKYLVRVVSPGEKRPRCDDCDKYLRLDDGQKTTNETSGTSESSSGSME